MHYLAYTAQGCCITWVFAHACWIKFKCAILGEAAQLHVHVCLQVP